MKALYLLSVLVLIALLMGAQPAAAGDGWIPSEMASMAASTETMEFASFANGTARIEFDWNRNTGDVSRFRCVNNSTGYVWGGVYEVNPATGTATLRWEGTCNPGQTASFPVNRFNIYWETGDLDGDGVPDGGIVLGNYQLRARWSAPN